MMARMNRMEWKLVRGWFCVGVLAMHPIHAREPDAGTGIIDVASKELVESSGLAASTVTDGYFWSHNDSGGAAKLFAFDTDGTLTGSAIIDGAEAIDWEDMAAFVDEGKPRLLVADVGDNDAKRKSVTLYVIDEPDPRKHARVKPLQVFNLAYPDGPRDCEAVAVDIAGREVILVSKSFLPLASVYAMSLPRVPQVTDVELQRVGTLAIPLVSAMDVDAKSGDLILVNYLQCFRFAEALKHDDAWIKQVPEVTDLPRLRQVEAVAVDQRGEIWVTSEGSPTKLARVPRSKKSEAKKGQ